MLKIISQNNVHLTSYTC